MFASNHRCLGGMVWSTLGDEDLNAYRPVRSIRRTPVSGGEAGAAGAAALVLLVTLRVTVAVMLVVRWCCW